MELLKTVADKYEGVGYADLFQLASATGIEVCNCLQPADRWALYPEDANH